jgi:predicted nucleic acid-binding protein
VRIALDTNVLVYAEGLNGEARKLRAHEVLSSHTTDEIVVPAQALAELFTVLTRQARWPATQARAAVLTWHDACQVADTTTSVLLEAMDLTAIHQYALRDAIMLAAAAQAGCRRLLSEDMQHGFIWRGVEIRNPFADAIP